MKSKKSEIRKEIKEQLFKDVTKAPLTPEEFKMYVNQLYYLDSIQTKFKNQRRSSIVNNIIKDDPTYPEICALRRTENSNEGDKKKIAKLIKEALVRCANLNFERLYDDTRIDADTVEDYINTLRDIKYDKDKSAQVFEVFEIDRTKDVEKYMKENFPIYQWCIGVRGLGTKLIAKILAGIGDIRRFPNPASLWSYCGVGDASSEKRVSGQQLKHSPKMKSTLFVLGESFIKQNSQYKVIYQQRKEKTLKTHPEWHNLVPCPIKNVGKNAPKVDEATGKMTWSNQHPKHAHIDAQRVMIKRFLAELYDAWYRSLGLEPPAKPYGVEIKGHHEEPMIVPYNSILELP